MYDLVWLGIPSYMHNNLSIILFVSEFTEIVLFAI